MSAADKHLIAAALRERAASAIGGANAAARVPNATTQSVGTGLVRVRVAR
jgi:hypothetical protein